MRLGDTVNTVHTVQEVCGCSLTPSKSSAAHRYSLYQRRLNQTLFRASSQLQPTSTFTFHRHMIPSTQFRHNNNNNNVPLLKDWRSSSLLNEPDATAVPQSWHHFDQAQNTWVPITPSESSYPPVTCDDNKTKERINSGN